MTSINNIPKEWKTSYIGDNNIADLIMGQSPPSSTYNNKGMGLPFLQGKAEFGEMYPNPSITCSDPVKIAEKNDILLSVRAPVGDVNINPFKSCIGRGLAAIRTKSDKLDFIFLFYYLKYTKKLFESLSSGSTFKSITKKEVEKFQILLPPIIEQKKIAEILLSIDKSIKEVKGAMAKTEKLKNGLMHKLLRNGIGHKEFKNTELGSIPINWKIKKLHEITNKKDKFSFTGGPFGSNLKIIDYAISGVRIIQLQNIGDGKFMNNYCIYTTEAKADQLRSCNIYPNDIIIAKMAEPVARACKVPNFDKRYVMCSDGIRLAIDKEFFNNDYILYSINSNYFRNNAIKKSTGTTRLRIGLSTLRNLKILMPPLPEQKQIAEILSQVDRRLELLKNKKEKLVRVKKGLMNDLFSGEKRVKPETLS